VTDAVRMEGVTKAYRGRAAVSGVDWRVPAGSIYALMGANGAGKTTLLRLALGLLWPDAGTIAVLGERLGRENARLRERVVYVAGGRSVLPGLRVEEWLRYAALLYPRWDEGRLSRFLDALGVGRRTVVGDLSSGLQTALHMAAAVAARPDLLLLDEPAGGLDPVLKERVLRLLVDMAAGLGTTVVVATHQPADAERLAERLAVLYAGRIVLEGEIDAVKASVRRLQVVFPQAWPEDLAADPRVLAVERRGRVGLVTVGEGAEAVADLCRQAGATLVESVDTDLAEVVRVVLGKEGYGAAFAAWE
jgi:ABC-2 type transport system ATP-binding protein